MSNPELQKERPAEKFDFNRIGLEKRGKLTEMWMIRNNQTAESLITLCQKAGFSFDQLAFQNNKALVENVAKLQDFLGFKKEAKSDQKFLIPRKLPTSIHLI